MQVIEVEKLLKWSILNILLVSLIITILGWFLQNHWKRRNLYKMAQQIRTGPFCSPIFRGVLKVLGNPPKILDVMEECFASYPNLFKVWFGPRRFYCVRKPEYLQIILNHPYSMSKLELLYKYISGVFGNGLITAPVPIWRRHRKVIMPALNQKVLDDYVEVFSEISTILATDFEDFLNKGPQDVFRYVNKCTLDMILETAIGVPVSVQDEKFLFGKWINRASKIAFLRFMQIWYHPDFIFKWTSLYREQVEILNNIHNFINKIIVDKRHKKENYEGCYYEEKPKRRDFLDLLLEISNFTDDELKDETLTFTIAASDTTATTTCFTLLMIAMHPEIQEKVYQEAIDALGPDREVNFTDLPQLKYTERVIKETLRLFPSAPIILRDVEADITLDNNLKLAANSSIFLGIFSVHRNPEYWPNPLNFNPDRFLPEEIHKRHPYCYLPFSGGPRMCAGPKYAYMAIKTMVATLIRKYKLTTPYKRVQDVELKTNIALRPRRGFQIQFELRN